MLEKIVEHELEDTWQIGAGILLKVMKYRVVSDKHYHNWSTKKVKKMDFYQLTEDIVDGHIHYPKGTFLTPNGLVIKAVDNPSKFHYELRTSGGVLRGDTRDFGTYLNTIALIMSNY